jgi:hypothetical protein
MSDYLSLFNNKYIYSKSSEHAIRASSSFVRKIYILAILNILKRSIIILKAYRKFSYREKTFKIMMKNEEE